MSSSLLVRCACTTIEFSWTYLRGMAGQGFFGDRGGMALTRRGYGFQPLSKYGAVDVYYAIFDFICVHQVRSSRGTLPFWTYASKKYRAVGVYHAYYAIPTLYASIKHRTVDVYYAIFDLYASMYLVERSCWSGGLICVGSVPAVELSVGRF